MSSKICVRPSQAVDVLEAAMSDSKDLDAWIGEVLRATARLLPSAVGHCASLLKVSDGEVGLLHAAVDGMASEALEILARDLGNKRMVNAFFFDAPHVGVASKAGRVLTPDELALFGDFCRLIGVADVLALGARVGADYSFVVSCPQPNRFQLDAAARLLLGRATLHIEAALRLRLMPSSMVAVIRPDGRVDHADGRPRRADARESLARHIRTIERARLRAARTHEHAIDPWTALVSGEYGFVERAAQTGRREFLVFENPPHAARWRSLSTLQAQALELSSRGLTGKLVAYALGVSERAVSTLLEEGAARVGCAHRTDLVRLASLLLKRGAAKSNAPLSAAEREVLELLRTGMSNDAIASRRGTHPRTVANQVASLLRKTNLPSRRALATLTDG